MTSVNRHVYSITSRFSVALQALTTGYAIGTGSITARGVAVKDAKKGLHLTMHRTIGLSDYPNRLIIS